MPRRGTDARFYLGCAYRTLSAATRVSAQVLAFDLLPRHEVHRETPLLLILKLPRMIRLSALAD